VATVFLIRTVFMIRIVPMVMAGARRLVAHRVQPSACLSE
jgi:hypothetical protein